MATIVCYTHNVRNLRNRVTQLSHNRPDKASCCVDMRRPSTKDNRDRTTETTSQGTGEIDHHGQDRQTDEPTPHADAPVPQNQGSLAFEQRNPAPIAVTNYQPAPSAWEDTDITRPRAKRQRPGMEPNRSAPAPPAGGSSIIEGPSYARIGKGQTDAPTHLASTFTSVRDVVRKSTAQTPAHQPKPRIRTPLIPEEWKFALDEAGLLGIYPQIPSFLTYGADAGIPQIRTTFTPPNHPSIASHQTFFDEIVNIEFQKGRYWGPFSKTELESIIGPFQTSPLSLIPKAGKPGKFRLIQNLSYPRNITHNLRSINSSIETDLYPCTWGTFATVATLVWSLPPGSLGACRDVSEAYRIIPLAENQWPGIVIRLEEDGTGDRKPFALNTCTSFGKKSSGGLFGLFGDALLDIFRASGIGPSLRWVDDFIFFLMRREFLDKYNTLWDEWRKRIERNGGKLQKGGRIWFRGELLPNDHIEEFAEDMSLPLRDLSSRREPTANPEHAYSMDDVDEISAKLGISWERSKDVPFGRVVPFIGFDWDLENKTVSLQEKKKNKYSDAVEEWRRRKVHTLEDVQKLYGKLLHTCLIIPEGRAYLTKLEKMLGIFHNTPHKPRHPPRHTDDDLLWWLRVLSKPTLTCEIPGAQEVIDVHAFSDASSTVGIGVVIRDRWRAWSLKPGWNQDQRDIGWAEAVGMELLVRIILRNAPSGTRFKVYGDNRGVVKGWWSGRSRNSQVNEVFKRIHFLLGTHGCMVYTKYVQSASNPADGPSRGIFPDMSKLLPKIDLPPELEPFILPLDHNEYGIQRQLDSRRSLPSTSKPKIDQAEAENRHCVTTTLESQAWEQFETQNAWERF